MSIIWTPLSHTALIRGSCPAISVCKRELIQIELNTAPQGKCNETAKIFLETIIDVVFAQMALKTFLCNKLSSFSINQSINQSFILTRYVKELKNSFKIRTCKKKKKSICMFDIHVSFILTINAWCFLDKFWAPVKSRPKKCENENTKH